MWSYALKLAGAAALVILAGVLAIVLFTDIWMKVGLGAAFLVVGGGLLFIAWRVDRKGREARKGLDELPPV
jgi:drug/metabolite transporter (DMT)-like permease